MSLDGRISLTNSVSTALSGSKARERVQYLRHEHDAILVGGTTAAVDNPSLTDRSSLPVDVRLRRSSHRLRCPVINTATTADAPTLCQTNCIARDHPAVDGCGVESFRSSGSSKPPRFFRGLNEGYSSGWLKAVPPGQAPHRRKLVDKVTFFIAPILIVEAILPSR